MKFDLKYNQLPLFTLLCGGLGALLRLWLYGTGLDEESLLVAAHPAGILVLILTALTIVALLWFLRHFSVQDKFSRPFPASLWGRLGSFAAAVSILLAAMLELVRRESALSVLPGFIGIAAAGAMAMTALCRYKGMRPNFLFHTVICLFFVARLISHYQSWSADPQLHDYCFQLLATVCAMLFSYHRAALDLKNGNRRALVVIGLLGTYFCCLSVVASNAYFFYAAIGAWMVSNLGVMDIPVPASKEDKG